MTKPTTPKPDAAYVQSLYLLGQSEGDEARLRANIADMRLLTEMAQRVEIPEQYRAVTKEVRTPFTRDTWLRVVAALTEKAPVAHVEPRDETSEQRTSANVAERWTQAAIEGMNAALGEDAIYASVKEMVRDQESVIKVVHKPDAWAKFPRRSAGEKPSDFENRARAYKHAAPLPFAWKVIDRLQMIFGEGEFGHDWAIEYGEYPTTYLGNRYEMVAMEGRLKNPAYLIEGKPKPEGELVSARGRSVKVEYWDAEWWHVVIDGSGAPGWPKPNPYAPYLPYFRAKAPDPVLLALKWLVPALDNLLTMKMNWAHLAAYPNPVFTPTGAELAPLGDDGAASTFEWKPGKLLQAPYGHKFEFVSPPAVGEDLNQLIVILRGLIDVAGIPSVFRGIGGADQAGYAINQLIAAANLTYKVLSKVAQNQLQAAAAFLWHIVNSRIRQTVYVLEMADFNPETGKPRRKSKSAWLGLTPNSADKSALVAPIDHLAKLIYSFRPVLPTDEQARAMIAMQLTNAARPLWGVRHALEKMQEEDPESIMADMKVENYLDEPEIKADIIYHARRKAGVLTPPQQPNPAAALVGPNGQPLLPGLAPGTVPPGQMAAGMPSIPGMNQPVVPPTPQAPAIALGTGGRGSGMYPGRPGGPNLGR